MIIWLMSLKKIKLTPNVRKSNFITFVKDFLLLVKIESNVK